MLQVEQIETLMTHVSRLDRRTLVRLIEAHRGPFPLDFTPQFLDSVELDRLRHIFVAVCLQSQQLPEFAASAA